MHWHYTLSVLTSLCPAYGLCLSFGHVSEDGSLWQATPITTNKYKESEYLYFIKLKQASGECRLSVISNVLNVSNHSNNWMIYLEQVKIPVVPVRGQPQHHGHHE